MKSIRWFCVTAVLGLATVPAARAQEFQIPKPGPEHEFLKKLVGTWDATAKGGGMETKGTMVWRMDLNGLWLISNFEGEYAGQKFHGYGMDSYDPVRKKYVSVWVDSMSTSPLVAEGTYDKEKKTLTMTGEGPGMDHKPTKYRNVSEIKDDDTILLTMYTGDMKEPGMTITFKRKK